MSNVTQFRVLDDPTVAGDCITAIERALASLKAMPAAQTELHAVIARQRAEIRGLLNELDTAKEEILQLRERAGSFEVYLPVKWGLTPAERRAIRCLLRADHVGSARLADVVCKEGGEPNRASAGVIIHRLRKKMTKWGMEIATISGEGYHLVDRSKWMERLK